MLMDWKNKYCQHVHTTQSRLQSQCNPYKNINSIFHRTRIILKCGWNYKGPLIAKAILKKKNKTEESQTQISRYTTKL